MPAVSPALEPPVFVAPMFTSEVARLLQVAPDTVRHYDRTGQLPAQRTAGGVRVWDPRLVAAFAERRSRESRPACTGAATCELERSR